MAAVTLFSVIFRPLLSFADLCLTFDGFDLRGRS